MSGGCRANDISLFRPGGRGQQGLGCRLRHWTANASAKPSCVLLPWVAEGLAWSAAGLTLLDWLARKVAVDRDW